MSDQARHIDWEFLDGQAARGVRAGDIVSADAGGLPIFRVMSLESGRAWLREIDTGADHVGPLTGFHWRAAAPA
jgi:hypothetical protein